MSEAAGLERTPPRNTDKRDGTGSSRHSGWLQITSGVMGVTLSLAVVGLALVGRL